MKTAVELLIEQAKDFKFFNYEDAFNFTKLLYQAKEMEKQQIIEAHGNKQKTKSNPDSIVTYGYTYTGEMYYNEKFKEIKVR
jgi:hypothetical protein